MQGSSTGLIFAVAAACLACDHTAVALPNCTAFCKYYVMCLCGADVFSKQSTSQCSRCVAAHQAELDNATAAAIPCSYTRAQYLCAGEPSPSPQPVPPTPPGPAPPRAAVSVFVSAQRGDDAQDGTSAETSVRSIARALAVVQQYNAAALLLDGTFRLAAPLQLSSTHSGLRIGDWDGPGADNKSDGHGQRPKPVLSGGALIPAAAWVRSAVEPGVWVANVSATVAEALDGAGAIYVGGAARRVVRSTMRYWNASLSGRRGDPTNTLGFVYSDGDVPHGWSLAPSSVARWRVAAFHSWNKAFHRVRSVHPANRTMLFKGPAQFGYGDYTYCSRQRYYFENVPEMVLPAGSGFWRSSATALHYAPLPGESVTAGGVVVPLLPTVLRIVGAHNVSLANIVVEHAAGVADCGGTASPRGACDSDLAEMADGAIEVGGAANGTQLTNVTVRDVGGYALRANDAPQLSVDRCLFDGCGAGGALVNGSPHAAVRNTYVVGFGMRYPAGVGISLGNSPNSSAEHCDISGGLYNGLVYGGASDAGAFTAFRFNHVHGNGRESDDGICDFGAIHGSNPGSVLPILIESNVFHNITAYMNGGNGIYMDAGSVGVQVSRNLVYNVSGPAVVWNGVMEGRAWPTATDSGTTRIVNNVLIADRDNGYSRAFVGQGQMSRNPAVKWNGVTAAQMERNVIVVDHQRAPSRGAWFNGSPCASLAGARRVANCSWDLANSFLGTKSVVASNVYFNASGGPSATFPGACGATALGECSAAPGARSCFNHGCACATLPEWSAMGEDVGASTADPVLQGPLRLVTGAAALALGIEPLHELGNVGPNWTLGER